MEKKPSGARKKRWKGDWQVTINYQSEEAETYKPTLQNTGNLGTPNSAKAGGQMKD
jgi:hypothetical protein